MTLSEARIIVRIANAGGWPCSADKEAEARKIVAEERERERVHEEVGSTLGKLMDGFRRCCDEARERNLKRWSEFQINDSRDP